VAGGWVGVAELWRLEGKVEADGVVRGGKHAVEEVAINEVACEEDRDVDGVTCYSVVQ
jgi:hypothetical protein